MIPLENLYLTMIMTLALYLSILVVPLWIVWRLNLKRSTRILLTTGFLLAVAVVLALMFNSVKLGYGRHFLAMAIGQLEQNLRAEHPEQLLPALEKWRQSNQGLAGFHQVAEQRTADTESMDEVDARFAWRKYIAPLPHGTKVDYSSLSGWQARLKTENDMIRRVWSGRGRIITGKIRLADHGNLDLLAARTSFFPGGYFAKAVYPDRMLRIVAHGYRSLNLYLDPQTAAQSGVLDVGELTMVREASERLKTLTGKIRLPEGVAEAEASLTTGELPGVWQDDGYECAAPIHRPVAVKKVRNGETFQFTGLSEIPYELQWRAAGCDRKTLLILPESSIGPVCSQGIIELTPAAQITFAYRPWNAPQDGWKTVEILGDGTNDFRLTERRDELGNAIALNLHRDAASRLVQATFIWYPAYFDDYGKQTVGQWEEARKTGRLPHPATTMGQVLLRPGHLYRFRSEWKKVDLVFRVDGRFMTL